MKNRNKDLENAFLALMAFLQDFNEDWKDELKRELKGNQMPTKLFYSLKEVSHITGLSVRAIKERYRRGTLQVVYDGTTPLIPAESLNELVEKLNRQILTKRRAA
jgi:hypothetical protein